MSKKGIDSTSRRRAAPLDLTSGYTGKTVNPTVEVRYGNLMRGESLVDDQIDELLIEKARQQSEQSSLNDLIKNLVKEFAYKQAFLTLREFLERFDKNDITKVIVTSFQDKIRELDIKTRHFNQIAESRRAPRLASEQLQAAKEHVLNSVAEYLDNGNLSGAVSLSEYFSDLHGRFPYLNFGELFDIPFRTKGDKIADEKAAAKKAKVAKLAAKKIAAGKSSINQTEISPVSQGKDEEEKPLIWRTLLERIEGKINEVKERLAAEAYKEKFEEDKDGFVMRYMIGRVISLSDDKRGLVFNKERFRDLLAYLGGLGVDIENINGKTTLYEMLATESEEMAKYVEQESVSLMRLGIREQVSQLPLGVPLESPRASAKLIFQKNFDVGAFYKQHIAPEIFRYNNARYKTDYPSPEVLLLHEINTPDKMLKAIFSKQHWGFFRGLVRTAKEDEKAVNNPENFLATIRMLMGFNNSPMLGRLKNPEVKDMLSYYLDMAAKKIDKNLTDATFYLKKSDDPRDVQMVEDCRYLPEIIGCRDLAKLLEWLTYRKSFKNDFPQYKDVPSGVIYHQCLMMLKDFAFVSKRITSEAFMKVGERRDSLEVYMKKALGITNSKHIALHYRFMREVSGEDVDYRAVYDAKGLKGFDSDLDKELGGMLMAHPEIDAIEWHGKHYEILPVEKADFEKVALNFSLMEVVPGTNLRERKHYKMEVLIYAGRNELIHTKDPISRMLAESGGKDVSDETRWLIVPANPEDAENLRKFLLMDQARQLIKLDDPVWEIEISNKTNKGTKAKTSALLKDKQYFSMAKRIGFWSLLPPENIAKKRDGEDAKPIDKDAEELNRKKVEMRNSRKLNSENGFKVEGILETQAQSLENLLAYNLSDFSPSSHTRYKAARAWKQLHTYFNPQFWGDKYRGYLKMGFEGHKKL